MIQDVRKIDIAGTRVVMRVDLNLSRDDKGKIIEGNRLWRLIPHLRHMVTGGAQVVLLSHLGRPQGHTNERDSLRGVAAMVQRHVPDEQVHFVDDCLSEDIARLLQDGARIILAENVRFHKEEETNDDGFAQRLASWGDIYVNDAFSCCHRSHASCVAITRHLPSYGGGLLMEEYETLRTILYDAPRPSGALIGGAKIGSKIAVLETLMQRFDVVVVGGAMAHNFLVARGYDVGRSFFEPSHVETAMALEEMARQHEASLLLPLDGVVGRSLDDDEPRNFSVDAIPSWGVMGDVGTGTVAAVIRALPTMKSLIWNGPLGAFEYEAFSHSTRHIGNEVARLTQHKGLLSVIGGGDTLSALSQRSLADKMSYASLSGGAFLSWVAGDSLAGLEALQTQ